MGNKHLYAFGAFKLDPQQKILLRKNERIPLHPKTYAILLALLESNGDVISKDDLMAKVWPDTFVDESSLTKNISHLRKALKNGEDHSDFVETISGVGYRFIEQVRRVEKGDGLNRPEVTHEVNEAAPPEKNHDPPPSLIPPPPSPHRFRVWSGLALLIIVSASMAWWRPFTKQPPAVDEFAPVRLTNHIAVDRYPSYSPDGKNIVFISHRDGLPAIYLMNADGGNVRMPVNNLPACDQPEWTSDGKKIHFSVEGSQQYEVNTDGSNLTKLSSFIGKLSPVSKQQLFVNEMVSGRKDTEEIFIANADRSNTVRLTDNHTLDADPDWSPDGKHIAFTCVPGEETDNPEICTMDADGKNLVRLTNQPEWDAGPLWSPDGSRIAFHSSRNCKNGNAIYVMNPDGSNVMRLTECEGNLEIGGWSPDSKKIVYDSNHDGNFEIYAINADPSHQTNISNSPAEDIEPVFSPDGKKIAFMSNRDGKNSFFIMNADGSDQHSVVHDAFGLPTWSPDGQRISFAATWQGKLDIYLANADGSNIVQLTHDPADETWPVWSRDGAKILFQSNDGKVIQLYTINIDGSNPTRISNSVFDEWQHDWSPDSRQVVFTRNRVQGGAQCDIWMMNADGSNPYLVAATPGNDEFLFPRFSPDGKRIAFNRRVASPLQSDVWVMNLDGSGQTRLTYLGGGLPNWSLDGKKIAFESGKRTGNSEIYVMDVR